MTSDQIRVRVVEFSDRKHFQLQWTDPNTGRKRTMSSGVERTGKKKERDGALKAAAKQEEKLRNGEHACGNRLTWEAFRERYESEVVPAKAANTGQKIAAVFNLVQRILSPKKLAQLTAQRLSYFQAELRREGKAEASIKSSLATLKSALRWATRMGLLYQAPAIEMPSRAGDKMRGRPITGEEFDRLIDAAPKIVGDTEAPSWKRLLQGLWLSGLRLNEALNVWWDRDDQLRVDMDGRRPMLWIPAHLDKGRKNRALPITPDFAGMLQETPEAERRGRVFKLPRELTRSGVSHVLADIGAKAGVKVDERTKGEATVVKYATAHDLRRSFGERWAARVMPNVLQELMRHEHISTTMKFYVGRNAERTADAVWAAMGTLLRDGQPNLGKCQNGADHCQHDADAGQSLR